MKYVNEAPTPGICGITCCCMPKDGGFLLSVKMRLGSIYREACEWHKTEEAAENAKRFYVCQWRV